MKCQCESDNNIVWEMLFLHLSYPYTRERSRVQCDSLLDLVSRGSFAVHFILTDETLPSLHTISIYWCVDSNLNETYKENRLSARAKKFTL